jgi:hypothetical protein
VACAAADDALEDMNVDAETVMKTVNSSNRSSTIKRSAISADSKQH